MDPSRIGWLTWIVLVTTLCLLDRSSLTRACEDFHKRRRAAAWEALGHREPPENQVRAGKAEGGAVCNAHKPPDNAASAHLGPAVTLFR